MPDLNVPLLIGYDCLRYPWDVQWTSSNMTRCRQLSGKITQFEAIFIAAANSTQTVWPELNRLPLLKKDFWESMGGLQILQNLIDNTILRENGMERYMGMKPETLGMIERQAGELLSQLRHVVEDDQWIDWIRHDW